MKPSFLLRLLPTAGSVAVFSLGASAFAAQLESLEPAVLERFLTAAAKQEGRVGLSVAVVREGRTILSGTYGRRSAAESAAPRPDTMFAIGSVTKQFTCACVLLLAEEGRLSVEDKVAKYYPELTRAGEIRLLDLMQHVSGYPDYYPLDFVDRRMRQPIDPDDLLRQYAGSKLDFEPGTRFSYSNTGYILLGRVVEKVSGESFGSYLERRILKPLGMSRTRYEPEAGEEGLAVGHTRFALSEPERAKPEGRGWIGAAGGIWSTAADLAKWDVALMEGRLLRPESFAVMASPRELGPGRLSSYGCGLGISHRDQQVVLQHNGAVSGFLARNAILPATRSAVVILGNSEAGFTDVFEAVLEQLVKGRPAVPQVAGLPATEEARRMFAAYQEGRVDRSRLAGEFNAYLTEEKLAGAARRLKVWGAPERVEAVRSSERGGMEVSVTRLIFERGRLTALMYRRPDGIIEQFFVNEE